MKDIFLISTDLELEKISPIIKKVPYIIIYYGGKIKRYTGPITAKHIRKFIDETFKTPTSGKETH
jgi:hypothetical protein